MNTPGWVAFWDLLKREADGTHRLTTDMPEGSMNDYALNAENFIKDSWSEGREASYTEFPLLGRRPIENPINGFP